MRLVLIAGMGLVGLSFVLVACSSGSTGGLGDAGTSGEGGTSGTSGTSVATPQVIVASSLVPGENPAAACPETGAFVTIGSFGEPPTKPATPVPNGGNATVACRVARVGETFAVEGSAELTGSSGGSITVTGTFRSDDLPSTASLTLVREGRSYAQKDCTTRFNPPLQAIAPGRVWVEITCPGAEAPALLRKCKASAEIRFENCVQQ